ncbi:DUF2065 family protein [Rhodobacteraceae bacterium NNCM2]|nr:DUF2065 family protein [Coraliihabitans acroporae]
MDLLAALALVLVIEGLALAIFATSLPELMASIDRVEPKDMRLFGVVMIGMGAIGYLVIRSV